ncbi:hypothetical protein EP7_002691 [Isosphaeraceae bacterium EP7]
MAINGENGSSQKHTTLRMAKSFANRPGTARPVSVSMIESPEPGKVKITDHWQSV